MELTTVYNPRKTAVKKSVIETLENRRLLSIATLSTGQGPGSAKIAVDAYGAFGFGATGQSTQVKDFTVGDLGVVNKSYVYFTPVQSFLAEDPLATPSQILTPATLPEPTVTSQTPTTLTSTFQLTGSDATGTPFSYQVELLQSLSGPQQTAIGRFVQDAPIQFQSLLTQTYRVTNLLGTSTNLGLVRFLQTQSSFTSAPSYGSANYSADGGRTLVSQSGFSFGSSQASTVLQNTDFVSLNSFGGSFAGGSLRSAGLDTSIAANNGLPASLVGVEGGFDSPSDEETTLIGGFFTPSFAQASNFSVGPRETVEFTTVTTFGEGLPIQALNTLLSPNIDVQGDFAFSSSVYNYNFPRDASNNLLPLTVTINRLGGTQNVLTNGVSSPTTVTISALPTGTTPAAGFSISPATVTFASGQTSATVVLSVNPLTSGAEPSSIELALSTSSAGAGTATPFSAVVNILPQTPVFTFASTTFAVSEGQGDGAVTIVRTGNSNGPASVAFATSNGTAIAGSDYSAVNTTVSFADGQTSKVVFVPVLLDLDENNVETVNLSLAGAAPSATLLITDVDAAPPTVTSINTVAGPKGILGVQLNFSETLLSIGDLTNFSLFSRTGEGASGSAKLKRLTIESATYDPATKSIFVAPAKRLAFNKNYQISLRPDAGLVDGAGNMLNQSPATGVASFVGLFSRGTRATYTDRTGDVVTLSIRRGTFEVIRDSAGEATTVSLFGNGTSIFAGSIRARPIGTTSIARINAGTAVVALPPNFQVGSVNTGV